MNPNEMFSPEAWTVFYKTLSIMVLGMLGVFVFMALFSAIILGLDKMFPHPVDQEKE
ncbi:MAG: hypothetical protein HC898_09985 [Phycisphaerales bacterium]|nr:hypothetical protein [Phycisphaerales bacterium]